MNDVPGANTIDTIPYYSSSIDAYQGGDETGQDGWVYWGSVTLLDVPVVAEHVE